MANQSLAKHVNERSILTMLRTQGLASRADIARRLSLTPATITRLVSDMTERKLVQEVRNPVQNGAMREPGRPGIGVALNPEGAFFLGVEIGVGILRYALLDLSTAVVTSSEVAVPKTIGVDAVVRRISAQVKTLTGQAPFHGRLRSVGVTVPGLVNSDGFIVHLPILGWKNVNLLTRLSGAVDLPCIVENNGNAAAFGSIYTQPSLPSVCTLFLKLGTGCGGAAIVNGRLLRGGSGTAGEFGHLRLTEHGHQCSCGQVGCLESWVNLAALARAFRGTDALSDADFARLPADAVLAADAGDRAALGAIESLSRHLSLGLVTLVNLFNPTAIELGGVMRPVLARCLHDVQTRVAKRIVPGTRVPDIRLSRLGLLECAIGAATIAHHHAFDVSDVYLLERELQP